MSKQAIQPFVSKNWIQDHKVIALCDSKKEVTLDSINGAIQVI
jgi:hypothetical protein